MRIEILKIVRRVIDLVKDQLCKILPHGVKQVDGTEFVRIFGFLGSV